MAAAEREKAEREAPGLSARLAALAAALERQAERRRADDELRRLSQRLLLDVGLSRLDLLSLRRGRGR